MNKHIVVISKGCFFMLVGLVVNFEYQVSVAAQAMNDIQGLQGCNGVMLGFVKGKRMRR